MAALIMLGACLPFFIDTGISMLNVQQSMTRPSTTTVEEVSDEYVQQEDDNDTKVNASARLLPDEIVGNRPVANLLTRNWRDNASSLSNPVEK